MSELTTIVKESVLRNNLLSSVCGGVLLLSMPIDMAHAKDDRPTVWIELGGQLERMGDSQEVFDPPFLPQFDHLGFDPVLPLQRQPLYSNGAEGSLSFQPKGSDWIFSASVRYGRSNGHKGQYQRLPVITWQAKLLTQRNNFYTEQQVAPYHIDASTTNSERHLILDFQAAKDVGLGMFGQSGSSVISAGVRIAQMVSRSSSTIGGVPDFSYHGNDIKYGGIYQSHDRYTGSVDAERSFQGIGPSLSWKGFVPVVKRGDDAQISLDLGLNLAALFGRQKVSGQEDVIGSHYSSGSYINTIKGKNVSIANHVVSPHTVDLTRSHSVIVPNVGAFAGASFRYSNAKLSFGYRADFFFGAMDGGIETRKSYDRNFYGPFATISVGLGG